jgi:hypothetical protein
VTVKHATQFAGGELSFDISGDHLVLTIGPDSLHICPHCPNLHVLILKNVSRAKMRELVLGIAHLASHLHEE